MIGDFIRNLKPVKRGDDIREVASSDRMNAIQDAILFILSGKNIKVGPGLRIGRTLGAVRLNVKRGRGRGGGGGDPKLWNFTTDIDKKPTITFTDGMVNNILPSNNGEKLGLGVGNNYVFAVSKAQGAQVEQVKLLIDNSFRRGRLLEAKDAPPSEVSVLIALAVVENDSIIVRRLRVRNVDCEPRESRREGKAPSTAGAEPFTRYYSWKVSDA